MCSLAQVGVLVAGGELLDKSEQREGRVIIIDVQFLDDEIIHVQLPPDLFQICTARRSLDGISCLVVMVSPPAAALAIFVPVPFGFSWVTFVTSVRVWNT